MVPETLYRDELKLTVLEVLVIIRKGPVAAEGAGWWALD